MGSAIEKAMGRDTRLAAMEGRELALAGVKRVEGSSIEPQLGLHEVRLLLNTERAK
jgi:hypothetical protein